MDECEQICYQQCVDMYNKKDKECFDLQLKLSRIEDVLQENCNQCFKIDNFSKPDDCGICEWARILKIIRGEE